MPDTGAPWNIPYVESADLVSDWPTDSLALANAIDAGLDAAGPAGIGSNVVQTVKTDAFTSTSATFVTVTGLTATITPSSATAKVLIIAQIAYGLGPATNAYARFKVTRGGTDIYLGDAASGRDRAVFGGLTPSNTDGLMLSDSIVYLDAPSVATPVTYQVEARTPNAKISVNRSEDDFNNANWVRGASSITVIEVAV